jgi:hypothetical protein
MKTRLGFPLLLVLLSPLAAVAAERFPFVIPGDDASPSITDLSHLSPTPAGADGFVRIRDGRFATDSARLKIWGVNTCFGANFPAREDAEKVAAHLAKLGVNGVRMHHHDTAPSPRGVWGPVVDGRRTLDPQQMDRQDYFLDQLHRRGIYVNLNLHVGRAMTEQEGFVTKDLPYAVRYDKYLLYFEPRMREQLKQFCRDYLTRYNPYRRLKRSEDPGIAMVEITNENSFSRLGPGIAAGLPEPYRGEFQRQWNRWLQGRYENTAALQQAWSGRNEPLGATLADSSAWNESLGDWRLRQTAEHPVQVEFNQPGPPPGVPAIKLDVSTRAAETNAQELQFPNLAIEPGQIYTLSFWARADAPRTLNADVSNQGPPSWNSVGFQEVLQLTPDWQQIHRVFRSSENIPGKSRICFKFGGSDVDLALAGLSLRRGGQWIVLPEGQSLEAGNIDIPVSGWSESSLADVRQFMVDTETNFIREITDFLKKDLGVRVPITASQINYHSPQIVAETCDYTDIHAYWQHPRFPRRPWDPVDWTIGNTPMEASPDADALLGRTPWRLLDRPCTLSEWNIPDPNDYAASVVPFAALVAALQDWDGVFFFQYQSGEGDWYADRVQRYFSFNGQPAKLALFTACAHLYRRGDLAPLTETAAGTVDSLLPGTLALSHRIGIDPRATESSAVAPPTDRRLSTADGRAVWDASDREQAYVSVNTPATRAVWGLVGGRSFDLGGVRFQVGQVDRNYAVLVLTSMDGQPLESSRRMLLAAVGSAENRDMVWNETRTSVGKQWGTGPTQVNGVAAEFEFPARLRRIQPLDGRGQPQGEVPLSKSANSTRFAIGPSHQTLWYAIEAE